MSVPPPDFRDLDKAIGKIRSNFNGRLARRFQKEKPMIMPEVSTTPSQPVRRVVSSTTAQPDLVAAPDAARPVGFFFRRWVRRILGHH